MKKIMMTILPMVFLALISCKNGNNCKLSTQDSLNIARLVLNSHPDLIKMTHGEDFKFINLHNTQPVPVAIGQGMIDNYTGLTNKPFDATYFLVDAQQLYNYLNTGLNPTDGSAKIQNVEIIMALQNNTPPASHQLTFVIATVRPDGHHAYINGNNVLEDCTPCPPCANINTTLSY